MTVRKIHTNAAASAAGSDDHLQKKFRYHHGNLRAAMIEAATGLLATTGIEGLSLRAISRVTGVSQAAPYSHFRDKDALLAAIAENGFQQLALSMAETATGAHGAKGRVEKLVTAYISFARDNRALFSLMFGREVADMKKFPTLAMTAGKSYALISAALSLRGGDPADNRFLTVAIWSFCHGLATLVAEEKINPQQFGTDDLAAFVRANVAVFDHHF